MEKTKIIIMLLGKLDQVLKLVNDYKIDKFDALKEINEINENIKKILTMK